MIVSFEPVPALLIRMSAPSNFFSVAATSASQPSAVATSQATASVFTPYSLATRRASFFRRSSLARRHDDVRAFGGEPLRHRKPDADAAAGDDRDLVLQSEVHGSLPHAI